MRHRVGEQDTAVALGSGDVPVLATPRLIAWLEAETVRAARPFVGAGQTTVGTSIRIAHRRATEVGDVVVVTAAPSSAPSGARLTFAVEAADDSGQVIADGEIDRVLVDRSRFLDRVGQREKQGHRAAQPRVPPER